MLLQSHDCSYMFPHDAAEISKARRYGDRCETDIESQLVRGSTCKVTYALMAGIRMKHQLLWDLLLCEIMRGQRGQPLHHLLRHSSPDITTASGSDLWNSTSPHKDSPSLQEFAQHSSVMPSYCLQDCHYFYRTALRGLNISTSISPLYA